MARSTVHYADSDTNRILKRLHNKLRPAGTPVQRVEYIIELLLLRIFEVKLIQDPEFVPLRAAFTGENESLLFSCISTLPNDQILPALNQKFFPFYAKILTAARKVWKGNLSTKVQDQLVLIEEVFSNSNFTNNVNSGNMAEIIGLVAELDGDRLLKTDLLGDAIESALSETGGTKDIGLHRTPDHVRQFMVALVMPTFTDQMFDPTVGTGGFMFDGFEYVMQGVSQDESWPGPKAHPEIAAWFKEWFAKHPVPMPTLETSTDFYRTGVGGIEYLGMVRKMAAINFYVRGLNPGNIEQGDALEKFGTGIIPKSKTVILANPPFGAERDKESYPNVWTEYATETETTILFVKLMLESLKEGGRCAVVVSEGFLTWDQNSARALRRALLDECNLQAIISLPQGLFVSKGGAGPKTSILYFVKGGRTKDVWFYKVSNDGYTSGTNRKVQSGCQLVEALDHFHNYVAQGKTPPETRHSFIVPADWIKVLDPRVKDKIRSETRAEMKAKEEEDRVKLITKVDAQVTAKKITAAERKAKLAEHAEVWQGKTENVIALKIERAHAFSFNLPNYRSSLTSAQVDAWKDFAAARIREDDPSRTLEQKYRALCNSNVGDVDELLSALEPRHTLELDLARQFLARLESDFVAAHPHLLKLQEIIATQQRNQRCKISDVCNYEKGKFPTQATPEGPYRFVVTAADRKWADCYQIDGEAVCIPLISSTGHGKASMSRIHYESGKFAVADLLVALTARNKEEIDMKYLFHVLGANLDELFVPLMKGTANVSMKVDAAVSVSFPVLPIEGQREIAMECERLSKLVRSAEEFTSAWTVDDYVADKGASIPLHEVADVDAAIIKDLELVGGVQYVGGEHIESGTGRIIRCQTVKEAGVVGPSYPFREGQVVYSKVRPNLRKCFFARHSGVCSSDIYPYTVASESVIPEYLALIFASAVFARQTAQFHERAGMPKVNRDQLATLNLVIPELEVQRTMVEAYNADLLLIEELSRRALGAKERIRSIINQVWES